MDVESLLPDEHQHQPVRLHSAVGGWWTPYNVALDVLSSQQWAGPGGVGDQPQPGADGDPGGGGYGGMTA